MTINDLPTLNASLNGFTTVLLLAGWACIARGAKRKHIICMVSALASSTLFLISYLTYHHYVGSVKFTAQGLVRPIYFSILLTHTVLAALVVPLVAMTVIPAIRKRWDKHRRLARWTLPIWLYVSVTGVVIYMMLYHWFPSANLPS